MNSDGIDRAANDEAARTLLNDKGGTGLETDGEHERPSRGVAAVDATSGEVTGGGSGTGGGNPGEDFDDDHAAGSNTAR